MRDLRLKAFDAMGAADLEGVTVVSVEQAVAAPLATVRLADGGARVIKVEHPNGDFARYYDRFVLGQSAYFVWLNRGKESICLDIKREADRRLLERMVAGADVFVQNLRPGILRSLGFGAAALRARFPRLIACEITGFGETGPRAALKAYDLIVQAEVGLCSITGAPEQPARVGVSVCDIAAGVTAHAAILQALYVRERTRLGRSIRISLFDSIAEWMNVPVLQLLYGDHEVARSGVNHPTLAPYGAYVCADESKIVLAVQNDREWGRFCEHFLRIPALIPDGRFHDNPARVRNRGALDELIAATLAELTAEQARSRLEASGIAHGRLNDLRHAAAHPHLRFTKVELEEGEVHIIAPAPVEDDRTPTRRHVPTLGQHSAAIRAEFGPELATGR